MFAGKRLFRITIIDFKEINPDELLKLDTRYQSVESIVEKNHSDIDAIYELFSLDAYPHGTYLVECEEVFVGSNQVVRTEYLHRHK